MVSGVDKVNGREKVLGSCDFPESCSTTDVEFLLVRLKSGPFEQLEKRKERDASNLLQAPRITILQSRNEKENESK